MLLGVPGRPDTGAAGDLTDPVAIPKCRIPGTVDLLAVTGGESTSRSNEETAGDLLSDLMRSCFSSKYRDSNNSFWERKLSTTSSMESTTISEKVITESKGAVIADETQKVDKILQEGIIGEFPRPLYMEVGKEIE